LEAFQDDFSGQNLFSWIGNQEKIWHRQHIQNPENRSNWKGLQLYLEIIRIASYLRKREVKNRYRRGSRPAIYWEEEQKNFNTYYHLNEIFFPENEVESKLLRAITCISFPVQITTKNINVESIESENGA
jgi:hypothetical protein